MANPVLTESDSCLGEMSDDEGLEKMDIDEEEFSELDCMDIDVGSEDDEELEELEEGENGEKLEESKDSKEVEDSKDSDELEELKEREKLKEEATAPRSHLANHGQHLEEDDIANAMSDLKIADDASAQDNINTLGRRVPGGSVQGKQWPKSIITNFRIPAIRLAAYCLHHDEQAVDLDVVGVVFQASTAYAHVLPNFPDLGPFEVRYYYRCQRFLSVEEAYALPDLTSDQVPGTLLQPYRNLSRRLQPDLIAFTFALQYYCFLPKRELR